MRRFCHHNNSSGYQQIEGIDSMSSLYKTIFYKQISLAFSPISEDDFRQRKGTGGSEVSVESEESGYGSPSNSRNNSPSAVQNKELINHTIKMGEHSYNPMGSQSTASLFGI